MPRVDDVEARGRAGTSRFPHFENTEEGWKIVFQQMRTPYEHRPQQWLFLREVQFMLETSRRAGHGYHLPSERFFGVGVFHCVLGSAGIEEYFRRFVVYPECI